jgi:hypothetical protein
MLTASKSLTISLLTLCCGLALGLPVAAQADELACGQVITQDVTLTSDLTCTDTDPVAPHPDSEWVFPAVVIDADDVTLDLNGHSLTSYAGDAVAVFGHQKVTIKNGGVSGLRLVDTSNSQVRAIETSGSFGSGITLRRAKRNRIERNRVLGEAGVGLFDNSTDNLVADNRIIAPAGALFLYSDHNRIERNLLCGGMGGPLYADNAHYNLIRGNLVPARLPGSPSLSGCGGYGGDGVWFTENTSHNQLIANSVFGIKAHETVDGPPVNGDGIRVDGSANTIAANTANDNDRYGITAAPGNKSGLNYARGNGNPAQCLNVICVPGPARPAPAGPRPPRPGGHPGSGPSGGPGHHHPHIRLRAGARQRLGRYLRLTVTAANVELWLSVRARLHAAGATYNLETARERFVAAKHRRTVRLALRPELHRRLARALRHGRRVTARLSVTLRDQAGFTARRHQRLTLRL